MTVVRHIPRVLRTIATFAAVSVHTASSITAAIGVLVREYRNNNRRRPVRLPHDIIATCRWYVSEALHPLCEPRPDRTPLNHHQVDLRRRRVTVLLRALGDTPHAVEASLTRHWQLTDPYEGPYDLIEDYLSHASGWRSTRGPPGLATPGCPRRGPCAATSATASSRTARGCATSPTPRQRPSTPDRPDRPAMPGEVTSVHPAGAANSSHHTGTTPQRLGTAPPEHSHPPPLWRPTRRSIRMTVIETLYPHHRRPAGEHVPHGHHPARLVVCLPAETGQHLATVTSHLSARLRPHAATTTATIDGSHFPLWRHPDRTERALLLLATPDPDVPDLTWCAGGPIGLLEVTRTTPRLRLAARRDRDDWHYVVATTPTAEPWSAFLDAHHADPDSYPLAAASTQFEAQPRIDAMAAAAGARFTADLYGPGLEALEAGPDVYADYQAGLLAFADGLLTLDGQLLVPSFSPLLVEQTLAERKLYHDRARDYLSGLHPATVLVAVQCDR